VFAVNIDLLIRSDNVIRRLLAISFRRSQNASSRLTLVLCPASTTERFTTSDFMAPLFAAAFKPKRSSDFECPAF
jgi:hypothetical protein